MLNCLAIGAGGFIGAVLRYLLNLVPLKTDLPIKTAFINVLGCFAMGIIAALSEKQFGEVHPRLILFLRVGVCGGFTAFSALALESGDFISDGRYVAAALYVVISAVLGIAAVLLGQFLVKSFF